MRQLAEHYQRSPDQISEEELRQYFLYLKNAKRASPSAFAIALCGIKFFYEHTLQGEWATFELARAPEEKRLPVVLSREKVQQSKGRKDPDVPLPVSTLEMLRPYWCTHRHPRVTKAATVHTLRHSYATHLLEAGVDLQVIQPTAHSPP